MLDKKEKQELSEAWAEFRRELYEALKIEQILVWLNKFFERK